MVAKAGIFGAASALLLYGCGAVAENKGAAQSAVFDWGYLQTLRSGVQEHGADRPRAAALSSRLVCEYRDMEGASGDYQSTVACVPGEHVSFRDLAAPCDAISVAPFVLDKNGSRRGPALASDRGAVDLICMKNGASGKVSWKATIAAEAKAEVAERLYQIPIGSTHYDDDVARILQDNGGDIGVREIAIFI